MSKESKKENPGKIATTARHKANRIKRNARSHRKGKGEQPPGWETIREQERRRSQHASILRQYVDCSPATLHRNTRRRLAQYGPVRSAKQGEQG